MAQVFSTAFPNHKQPLINYSLSSRIHTLPLPTPREWRRHAVLLLATALTSTFAGVLLAAPQGIEPSLADPVEWFDYITYIPLYYVAQVWLLMVEALRHPALLAEGAKFAGSLLSILGAHEAGHYLMCRRYGVRATLPFFLPAPPLFLAGTFGAFIKIKSPIPSRRALFDIGLAGPLAGFAVALPIAVWGLATAQTAPTTSLTGGGVIFHDPLLFRLLAAPMNLELTNLAGNPFYFAAWIGLLVTSLNLLPVGQLDGGHAVYATLGPRVHYWLGRAAVVVMCALTYLGFTTHGAPTGFVYTILLFFLLRAGHPQVLDEDAVGSARNAVAVLTLIIFILCFLPFPITVL